MASDMFSAARAQELLKGKSILFFGDSNTRALYKDLLWLLEDGRLIPDVKLKTKNELSHANDFRLSNGELHNGCNYEEVREYNGKVYVKFQFITRLYLPAFLDTVKNLRYNPDVVVINSGVWDLTRWGSDGVAQFKKNLRETLKFLKDRLPSTRIIWPTILPPAFDCRGGFLTKEIEFIRGMLPWHIMFANKYVSDIAASLQIDVLDFHYHFQNLLNYHTTDGIHWTPTAVRYATNMFLTHVALVSKFKLPGNFKLDQKFIKRSQKTYEAVKPQTEFCTKIWQSFDVNTATAINKNIQNQLMKYVKPSAVWKNVTNTNDRVRDNQRYPLKHISNYNCNSTANHPDRNQKNMFRNVQNPGRVTKQYRKPQNQQFKKNMRY